MGIDLIRHRLKGTTVEFYDCAGQVDYAGMQQTFLSRRALYLVVWDVGRCRGKGGKALDEVGARWSRCVIIKSMTMTVGVILALFGRSG